MEYLFELSKKGERVDTFTRYEELSKVRFQDGIEVDAYSASGELIAVLKNTADVDEFLEARARASQWGATLTSAADLPAKPDVVTPYYTFEVFNSRGELTRTLTDFEHIRIMFDDNPRIVVRSNQLHGATVCVLRKPADVDEFLAAHEHAVKFNGKLAGVTSLCEPPVNAKNIAAANKPVMSPVPPVALMALGAAMNDGARKYGRFNWRATEVTASVFYDAMMRHIADWYNGENHAPDSRVHHLAHLMADCAIVLDAIDTGVFIDDRDKTKPCSVSREPKPVWRDSE